MFNRSRKSLARWFTLSMGSILVGFAAITYHQRVVNELAAFDDLLYRKTRLMAATVRYRWSSSEMVVNLDRVPLVGDRDSLTDSSLVYARWYDTSGQLVRFFGSSAGLSLGSASGFETIVRQPVDPSPPPPEWLRQLTLPVLREGVVIGYLQVGSSLTPAQDNLRNSLLLAAIAVPASLGLIALASWWLGGLAMQPIHQTHRQLERFTADAAHELRAPMGAILNNAELGLMAESGAEQQQRLENIADLAKVVSGLVGSLLFLARHYGPLAADVVQSVNLTHLLQAAANDYARQAAQNNIQWMCQLPPDPVVVQGDRRLLLQAIANLIANACAYTSPGGTVSLRLQRHGQRALIQVEDSGVGIPPEDLPYIFDRFYRVDLQRSRHTGGVGLGLAIAQQIATAHRGHLTVTSHLQQGSTFQIELPLSSHG